MTDISIQKDQVIATCKKEDTGTYVYVSFMNSDSYFKVLIDRNNVFQAVQEVLNIFCYGGEVSLRVAYAEHLSCGIKETKSLKALKGYLEDNYPEALESLEQILEEDEDMFMDYIYNLADEKRGIL